MIELKIKDIKRVKEIIMKRQKYRCKICGDKFDLKNPKGIHLDHNHSTGMVRSVLCRRCNTIEGKLHNVYNRYTKAEDKSELDKRKVYKGLLDYLKVKDKIYKYPIKKKYKRKCKRK